MKTEEIKKENIQEETEEKETSVFDATAECVQELLNAAISFHKLHLQVKGPGSYAQHKALNEIYDALPELADSVAEGYQGASESILKYPELGPVMLDSIEDALQYLRNMHKMICELQEIMPYSEIINELDNVKAQINSTKYKLIFLA